MAFTVASWNVLATAYIKRSYYPRVLPELLESSRRVPALVRRVAALDADVICLQEVERDVEAELRAALAPRGYVGHYAEKRAKPDGCATFVRAPLVVRAERVIRYADAPSPSGHLALILELEHEGRALAVANTHVRWDAPGTPRDAQIGLREIEELLRARTDAAWIVCGDLNVTRESEVIRALEGAGLREALGDEPTCIANGRARKIDWLLHDAALAATPRPLRAIDDATSLPSEDEPSDHLAIVASFEWR